MMHHIFYKYCMHHITHYCNSTITWPYSKKLIGWQVAESVQYIFRYLQENVIQHCIAPENVIQHCLVSENGDRDPRFISFKVLHSTSWVLHTFTSHMLRQDPIIFSFHTLSKTFRRYNSLIFHGCKPQFQRQFASFVYIVMEYHPKTVADSRVLHCARVCRNAASVTQFHKCHQPGTCFMQ